MISARTGGGPVLRTLPLGRMKCRDRTGLLLSWHLVVTEGLDPQAAVARIKEIRPKALSADGWTEMAYRILSRTSEAGKSGWNRRPIR